LSARSFVAPEQERQCTGQHRPPLLAGGPDERLWVQHVTDVEDLQQALRTFKETYNQQWLIERLGFRAPAVVRRTFALTPAA